MKKIKIKERAHRKNYQLMMLLLLPIIIIGGYFYPLLGFAVVGLIFTFLIISSMRGRSYCGWLCPMGALHERITSKVSLQNKIPALFRSIWFRFIFFIAMMSFMMSRLVLNWGDTARLANVFRTMWIVSTSIGLLLGLYFKPRIWCTICPMGSMQGVISKKIYLLHVKDNCVQCGKCQMACPISTYPGKYKQESGDGIIPSIECLRCYNCVENCPKQSLYFK